MEPQNSFEGTSCRQVLGELSAGFVAAQTVPVFAQRSPAPASTTPLEAASTPQEVPNQSE